MAYDEKPGAADDADDVLEQKSRFDDDDWLAMVRTEFVGAIGMDPGDDVVSERIKALEYAKGDVSSDVKSMNNRSQAVSTDVADGVYTALPDLVEIFIAGEEIGSFRGVGEEDEEAAKQETQVVNHVIMERNDGFGLVHDAIHDALLQKTGIFHFWVEEEEKTETEDFTGQNAIQLAMAQQAGEIDKLRADGQDEMGNGLYAFCLRRRKTEKRVVIETVDPNRFCVARDTVELRNATYCCMMTTPRVQELKAMGFDPDLLDELPAYNPVVGQEVERARDTAGESNTPGPDSAGDLRMVALHVHCIRVDANGDGEPEIWRIVTDEGDAILLDKERLPTMPFAGGSPYRHPHRFYGRSLADQLLEVQRIKTALTRIHLDAGFFSLNQRHEIAMADANEFTLADYLNNVPGYPVRSKTGNALKPLTNARSDFQALESLEYFSVVGEQRSGVVRNAQGLNPDTLHDTAKGAEVLMTAAQKRLRFIARTLAETMFKDLFIGVHTMLRTAGDQEIAVKLRNKWTPVNPSRWGVRDDMTIEIGMGASGRETEIVMLNNLLGWAEKVATLQGGFSGPLLTAENAYKMLSKLTERAGLKGQYWNDPEQNPMQQEPQPDPAIVKAQMDMQAKREEMQMKERHTQMQFQKDMELAKTQQQDDMARAQIDAEDKQRAHELAMFDAQQKALDSERSHAIEVEKLRLEQQKLEIEARKLAVDADTKERDLSLRERDIDEKGDLERRKTMTPDEIEEYKASRSGRPTTADAVMALTEALSRPMTIRRGPDGFAEAVE